MAEDGRGGSASIAVTIEVTDLEEPPGTPEAPGFGESTPTELEVSWQEPPNTGFPITDYDPEYREGTSGPMPSSPMTRPMGATTAADSTTSYTRG